MGQPILTAYQDKMDRCVEQVTSAILNVVYHYYIYTRRDAFSQQRWIQVGGGGGGGGGGEGGSFHTYLSHPDLKQK